MYFCAPALAIGTLLYVSRSMLKWCCMVALLYPKMMIKATVKAQNEKPKKATRRALIRYQSGEKARMRRFLIQICRSAGVSPKLSHSFLMQSPPAIMLKWGAADNAQPPRSVSGVLVGQPGQGVNGGRASRYTAVCGCGSRCGLGINRRSGRILGILWGRCGAHGVAHLGKVRGGRRTASKRLTVPCFHHVAQTAAHALFAVAHVAEKVDGDAGIHTAVNVLRGQLGVDVGLVDNLRLVFAAGGDHPAAFAFGTVGGAVLADAITVMDGNRQYGRPDAVPQLAHSVLRRRLCGGVNVRFGSGIGFGDQQGDAIFCLAALLRGAGSRQVGVGQTHLAGQHFGGDVLIHGKYLLFCSKLVEYGLELLRFYMGSFGGGNAPLCCPDCLICQFGRVPLNDGAFQRAGQVCLVVLVRRPFQCRLECGNTF
nr:MAG TPA: hypothetical protein [Caudoviricetes sp.]